jgi:hypothetical protein
MMPENRPTRRATRGSAAENSGKTAGKMPRPNKQIGFRHPRGASRRPGLAREARRQRLKVNQNNQCRRDFLNSEKTTPGGSGGEVPEVWRRAALRALAEREKEGDRVQTGETHSETRS